MEYILLQYHIVKYLLSPWHGRCEEEVNIQSTVNNTYTTRRQKTDHNKSYSL